MIDSHLTILTCTPYRQGISLDELFDLFSTENAARQWFEKHLWPDGPVCPRCGLSDRAGTTKNGKPMSHWCGACRRHFSVRMGTVMEESPLPLRKYESDHVLNIAYNILSGGTCLAAR